MAPDSATLPEVIRPAALARRLGVSRGTIHRYVRKGILPRPIHLGPKARSRNSAVGFVVSEIVSFLEARSAARDAPAISPESGGHA
jgi:predicted DNA-binding transcriptional regulator AlpA